MQRANTSKNIKDNIYIVKVNKNKLKTKPLEMKCIQT